MLPIRAVLVFLCGALSIAPRLVSQIAPAPQDPPELVTGLAEVLSSRNDRAGALDLLNQARWNYSLRSAPATSYVMKVSFHSNGNSSHEGDGSMEDIWAGPSGWRWTANFAGSTGVRLGNGDEIYGTTDPVPMRVQMVRSALFWPIATYVSQSMIRFAKVMYKGGEISCFLSSGSVPTDPEPRFWVETEYCVDPQTGLLVQWSEAPGVYVGYDYTDAIKFHGHVIPRTVTVTEERRTVLQIHVDSVEDAGDLDPKLFQPTPEMMAQPTFTLSVPGRFPIAVDPDQGATAWIQPVIVHVTIGDEFGEVIEAEALQTSDRKLAKAAIDVVKNSNFPPTGMQRDAYINVQFHHPVYGSLAVYLHRNRRRRREMPRPPRHPRGRPIPHNSFGEQAGDHF